MPVHTPGVRLGLVLEIAAGAQFAQCRANYPAGNMAFSLQIHVRSKVNCETSGNIFL